MSGDLGTIVGRVRVSPPRCIAGAAPRLEPGEDVGDGEQFGTAFWLGCACGCRETAVLCFATNVRGEMLNLGPLAIECSACNRVTEIFDPDRDGYDPEVCGEPRGIRGSGERQRYRCAACGHGVGEAVASFSFNDPAGFLTLPEGLAGREQDTFDWFTLEWRCAGCGEICYVIDYERG